MRSMKTSLLLATAGIFIIAPQPASADWVRISSVDIPDDGYADVRVASVPERVQRLRFKTDADVKCDAIRAEYENGYTQDLFSGTLHEGQTQTVYFPEGSRRVERISMTCRSEDGDMARVALYADASSGSLRSDVLSSPSVALHAGLVPVASREFGDTAKRSVMLDDARPVDAVAIQPVGGDARCTRISARFDDGATDDVVPNDGDRMQEGTIYRIPISDRGRDLNGIDMVCRASGTDNVSIRVFTSA